MSHHFGIVAAFDGDLHEGELAADLEDARHRIHRHGIGAVRKLIDRLTVTVPMAGPIWP